MEYTRAVRYTLYLDTNKQTIKQHFPSLREVLDYCREIEDLLGESVPDDGGRAR